MNYFVHRMLGHYIMNEAEDDGSDLGGGEDGGDAEEGSDDAEEGGGDDEGSDGEEEGVVVTIGDEPPPAEDEEEKTAPKWVKELRKTAKEQARRIRELEAEKQQAAPEKKVPELGKKPSMSDDDIDYDEEKYEQRLTDWYERKREIDGAQAKAREQEESQKQEWQGRLNAYAKAKEDLKAKDFEDAESAVLSTLNVTQQGIIVQGAENAALIVYALGKNPAKAKELAGITDAVKFAFAIAKLETQVKVQAKSKSAPPPEGKVRGSAPVSGSVDSNLERLRADAEKTGDYSKVTAYRKQQREKQKA